MTQPGYLPYQSVPRQTVDAGHLRTLSILHYVLGGLQLLFATLLLFYVGLGVFMLTGGFNRLVPTTPQQNTPDFKTIGTMMTVFGSVGLVLGWTLGIFVIVAGRRIQARRSYVLCVVVAAIECIGFPLGTALGVFTLVVLCRESVSAEFKANATPVA